MTQPVIEVKQLTRRFRENEGGSTMFAQRARRRRVPGWLAKTAR